MHLKIPLDNIPVSALGSDNEIARKIDKYLPEALLKMGETAAQEAWETLQKSFRGSGLKLNSSSSDKAKFIRETAAEYARNASADDKRKVKNQILEQLQEQRKSKK